PPRSSLFPYTTLFRSRLRGLRRLVLLRVVFLRRVARLRVARLRVARLVVLLAVALLVVLAVRVVLVVLLPAGLLRPPLAIAGLQDRKSTRLNSSHVKI